MLSTAAAVPTRCERCTSGALRGVAYTLRQGNQRLLLDHDAVVARVRGRELAGTDFVRSEDGSWHPLAAHPAFRQLFFPGVAWPDAPRPLRRSLAPIFRPILGAIAVVGTFGVVFAVAWHFRVGELAAQLPEATADAIGMPATPAPAAQARVEAAPDLTMAEVVKRVGPVSEPRTLLLASAWRARFRGGAAGLAEATALAERAAVRVPDVETLATLATFYAEADAQPDLRVALIKRARDARPDHVAVVRAELAEAVAESRLDDARASAVRCLALDPHETWCALNAIALTKDMPADQRQDALDALVRASQPGVALVRREATKAAIRAGAADSADRVAALLTMVPADPEINGYKGVLALQAGDLATASATARKLGDKAPARLRLDLAAHEIGAGDASSARAWLAPLAAHEPTDPEERFRLHLHGAQADYLEALGSTERMRGAADSADSVLAVRPQDPTAAQVRMLAALAISDLPSARRAWGSADLRGLPGPDSAQILLTAVEMELVGGGAREAGPRLEAAQHADPASPDTWLWAARVALEVSDVNSAVSALRTAVAAVDGSAGHRNPLRYSLPHPADNARIEEMFHAALDSAAGQEKGLAVGLGVLAWMRGDTTAALHQVSRLVSDMADADAMILAARIHLDAGEAAVALPLAEAAAAERPKEARFQVVRARCLLALGRPADARKAMAYAKGGAPNAEYYLVLTELDGDAAGREKDAREALALDPYSERAVALINDR